MARRTQKVGSAVSHTDVPHFLVVGSAKSGTTSLHAYLGQHPDIYVPRARKELYYWHIQSNPNRSVVEFLGESSVASTLEEYLGYFEEAREGQLCGEVCPSYLYYHPLVIENLERQHRDWKNVRIIIILREPVSRMVSQYRFVCQRRLDPESLDFEASLRAEPRRLRENVVLPDLFYQDATRYVDQVAAYLDAFNHVHVCLYDDLRDDPDALLRGVFEFLGVDPKRRAPEALEVANASAGARRQIHPRLEATLSRAYRSFSRVVPSALRAGLRDRVKDLLSEPATVDAQRVLELRREFADEVNALESLIGRDLSAWKR